MKINLRQNARPSPGIVFVTALVSLVVPGCLDPLVEDPGFTGAAEGPVPGVPAPGAGPAAPTVNSPTAGGGAATDSSGGAPSQPPVNSGTPGVAPVSPITPPSGTSSEAEDMGQSPRGIEGGADTGTPSDADGDGDGGLPGAERTD